MRISIVKADQLTSDQLAAWSRIQRADATLANPFFRPEFTQAVQAVRDGVEVAVWEQAGEPVGFLPFQRHRGRAGRPVGFPMNDFQGAIARSDVAWCPQEVLRAARLRWWQFDHLVATQTAFGPFQYVFDRTPYIDLTQGYEAYHASRAKTLRKNFKKAERKASRLGDVRFELNSSGGDALAKLIEWKTEKCRRTRIPCTFARDWTWKMVDHILANPTDEFSGLLLTLHIGDRLAAVEFAMRAGHVLHEWHSAYNAELAECSPGLIMEHRLTQEANSHGILRIDLGKGDEAYKGWFASGYDPLAEGAVHVRPLQAPIYRTWFRTKDRLRSTPLRGPVRQVRRWTLSTRLWMGLGSA